MSEAFHDGSVVGEEIRIRLIVSLTKQRGSEDLRGLNETIITTGNGLGKLTCGADVPQSFYHIGNRHNRLTASGFFIASPDGID